MARERVLMQWAGPQTLVEVIPVRAVEFPQPWGRLALDMVNILGISGGGQTARVWTLLPWFPA